jgi:hypothetical protein
VGDALRRPWVVACNAVGPGAGAVAVSVDRPWTPGRPRRREPASGADGTSSSGAPTRLSLRRSPRLKKSTEAPLTDDQRTVNLLHATTRAPAERGNSLLKTTVKALRRVSLCPWRIGAITAAALVLLHHQHGRTT